MSPLAQSAASGIASGTVSICGHCAAGACAPEYPASSPTKPSCRSTCRLMPECAPGTPPPPCVAGTPPEYLRETKKPIPKAIKYNGTQKGHRSAQYRGYHRPEQVMHRGASRIGEGKRGSGKNLVPPPSKKRRRKCSTMMSKPLHRLSWAPSGLTT